MAEARRHEKLLGASSRIADRSARRMNRHTYHGTNLPRPRPLLPSATLVPIRDENRIDTWHPGSFPMLLDDQRQVPYTTCQPFRFRAANREADETSAHALEERAKTNPSASEIQSLGSKHRRPNPLVPFGNIVLGKAGLHVPMPRTTVCCPNITTIIR